jgi:hypothetical protein
MKMSLTPSPEHRGELPVNVQRTSRQTTLRLTAVPADEAPRLDKTTRMFAIMAVFALFGVLVWVIVRSPTATLEPLTWSSIAPPSSTAIHPWRFIVLHHSASRGGDAQVIDRDHVAQNGWDGIGYHFVVGNGVDMPLGRIEATFRWRQQSHGAHAGALPLQKQFNTDGVGVCMIGNYEKQSIDPLAERRLVELCAQLIDRVPTLSVGRIIGHRDVPGKSTACPGRGIDLERLRYLVRQELMARGMTVR